ncbi:MAG TPA: hypothetical protein DEA55_10355 [Rhodospirillaceae bacterium]|nr:hypothetical protein [Rhodospirillaceae bacterium]
MPPEYKLRPGSPADFDFYKFLHHDLFKDHISAIWGWDEAQQDKIAAEEFAESGIIIIQADGRDVGVLQVEEKAQQIHISQLWISREFQGRGIGSAVTIELLKSAEIKGFSVRLHVLKTNHGAKRFYERFGFVPDGESSHGGGFYMRKDFVS